MLICSECGKTIANTNPRVHYGICANCPIPDVESEVDAIDNYGSGRLINTHSIVLDVKNKELK